MGQGDRGGGAMRKHVAGTAVSPSSLLYFSSPLPQLVSAEPLTSGAGEEPALKEAGERVEAEAVGRDGALGPQES